MESDARQNVWEIKILRKIYGPFIEQRNWRSRNNKKIQELYKDLDIIVDIKGKD